MFKAVFGRLTWTPPQWLARIGRRRVLNGTAMLIGLGLAMFAGYRYHQAQPKPPMLYANAIAPPVTPIVDDRLVPQPLFIDFTVKADPRTPLITVDSIARIDLAGNNVEEGVSIQPDIPGQWQWSSETQLRFQPAQDWPAGQDYVVRYDKSLFAPGLLLSDNKVGFRTAQFTATLDELQFYQDPAEHSLRKVVATLSFSHPVDAASLEDKLSFAMRQSGETVANIATAVDYTISYSPTKRIAYVHSTPLTIPQHETYLTLRLKENLKPQFGPARLEPELLQNVRIPDIASYFRVSDASSLLVRNDDNEPVQTLTLEFTDRVRTQNLQARLNVYLLPTTVVVDGKRQTNRYWQSPREITPDILDQAEEITVELTPVEYDAAQLHSLSLDIPDGRGVYLRIAEGLRSEGDFVMSLAYDTVLYLPNYPKEATIAQQGAILPLTGTHRLTFVSRGVDTLKVELGRLLDSQVNHLASQTGGDISNPYFTNYEFGEANLSTRFSRLIDVNAGHPKTAAYSNIDLSEFLPDGGHYFVTVRGWDKVRNRAIGGMDQRFILITDLGLLIKSNADSSQDIFVHSIASGEPVAGATIELLGKNGIPIISRLSSVDGHVSMPAANGFEYEKTPTVYVIRLGQDSVFMPYQREGRKLQYSRFDIGGERVQTRNTDERLKAQLFTERGLYRPGDTIHLAAIVKRDDWIGLARLPLILAVRDARGQSIMDKRIQLPADGFVEDRITTDSSSPTGNYNATLYLVYDGDRRRPIGDTSFKVEEFQPDRMRIRSEISGQKPRGWIKPGDLFCEVILENLFGTPAEQRRVLGQYELTPSSIFIDTFPDYTFNDPLRHGANLIKSVSQTLAETTTDQDGKTRLPLALAQYDKGIYRLTVLSEGFEQGGGRSVKSLASVMMSPLDHLVGYKADGDLGFIKKGAANSVRFLAVDSDATALAVDDLTLAIVEERFVSTLVKRPNGTYAYQSIQKENQLSSQPFSISQSGTTFSLPTQSPGRYAVKLVDRAGLVYSRVSFAVAGARNLSGNLEKNAELELSLNGSSFQPGAEIEMEITAPYSGAGLITIEREKVFSYKWFHSGTSTSIQRIRVPDELEGNAYVNVSFIRDLNSPEVFVSPLSYAVAAFSVDRDARTVQVEIDTPQRVKPGEALQINYTASTKSRVIIYAVDEGILQVARYQQPDPLEFFLRKMALQVDTFQLVDLILPEFEAYRRSAAPGGGGAAMLLGNNLNPFRRVTDAPVVYWSGIVEAGPDQRSVVYDVPDYFNGQLRIMAIAVSESAVGRSKRDALVRAAFVITPNVLTAAAPGDEFEVNVGLSNNLEGSGKNAKISLSVLPSEHLEIVGERELHLLIDEGREGRGKFRILTRHQLGAADISFVAQSQQEISRLTATLSVRPSVPYVATMQAGADRADPLKLSFERTLFDEFALQTAAASVSPLVLTDGMLGYLDAFPHACAEQIVSKVFPQIGFLENQDYSVDETKIRQQFAATIQKLRSRQTTEGGFRFWVSSPQPAEFPSVYIMHFFTDAIALDLTVPRDMQEAGLGYLRRLAAIETSSLQQARLRAYAIYVLTRNSSVTTNYLTNLHEYLEANHKDAWRKDLTAAYMAASYAMLKLPQLANDLIGAYKMEAGEEMTSDFDTRLGRDAQYLYLLARHFPQRLQSVDSSAIQKLVEPVMRNRFNTLSSAYTIMALNAYTRAVFDKQGVARLRIDAMTANTAQQLSDVAIFARAQVNNGLDNLQIAGAENRNVYYVLSQSGFDRVAPTDSLSEGLELSRVYLDDQGNPVTQATVGTELNVRLRVRSTGRLHTNVAVIDLLPGGFEVLRESVNNRSGWSADYRDIREDRVVVYGSFSDKISDINYRVKLTTAGSFVLPSAYAGSMYDRSIQARTAPGRFRVDPIQ